MIKTYVYLLACLVSLMSISGAFGQALDSAAPASGNNILGDSGISSAQIQDLMNKIQQNPIAAEEDLILNNLLSIPFEKRQYVFPEIAGSRGLSKKITSHPEIAIWKGKLPTTLPPQLRAFAAENLLYLPPKYYVFLDPDLWQERPVEGSTQKGIAAQKGDIKLKLTPHIGEDFKFPAVQDLYTLSPQTIQNYKKTDLTDADVKRVFSTVNALKEYYATQEDPTFFEHQLLSLMLRNDKIEKDLSDPFASLVERLKLVQGAGPINIFFKKQGWKNADEFASKADRILKAQRVTRLNPAMAIQFQKIRSYPQNMPNSIILNNLRMVARLFESPPGDVFFIEPYKAEIRKQLKPDFILLLGTPVYIE